MDKISVKKRNGVGRPSKKMIAAEPLAVLLASRLANDPRSVNAIEKDGGLKKGVIANVLKSGNANIKTIWQIEDSLRLGRGSLCAPRENTLSYPESVDKEDDIESQCASAAHISTPAAMVPFPVGRRPAANLDKRATRGLAAADDSHGTRVPDTDEEGDPYRFPTRLVLVPVTGDSMSPVVLERQYVFIDADREGFEKNDGIYVVSILEPEPQDERPEPMVGTFVKRCELHEDMLYLKSINADYSLFSVYLEHCRLWPVLGTWYDDKGKPPEGF